MSSWLFGSSLTSPGSPGAFAADGGQYGAVHRPARREPKALTDGQRITRMRQDLEAQLDDCGSEAERAKLIDAYNAQVRRMNIRFRRTGPVPGERPDSRRRASCRRQSRSTYAWFSGLMAASVPQ